VLLCKGVEVEMYTGTTTGDVVGYSDKIVKDLDGFVREPDSRNVEYTTAPLCCYDRLLCALLKPRQLMRQYLQKQGNYTLIPGSTLSLGNSDRFYRSDPGNPYHTYIEKTYGTKVVTASIHLNIGIPNPEVLIRACRLIRLEAPLYLALSASSPFLDEQVTGYHSTRWQMFPKTPQEVPLFTSHHHFITWTEEQLALKTMQNVRHLWSSVRPNGDNRPYSLNRLELRICDLIVDPIHLLAVIALLEARLTQLMEDPELDPLSSSKLSPAQMLIFSDKNEQAAAQNSLDAQLYHWQDGRVIIAKEWLREIYEEVYPIAKRKGFACFLSPMTGILKQGNQAQKWLKQYQQGLSIREIMTQAIQDMVQQEEDLESKICAKLLVA
jgi:predicted glutamate--cysteine ligase